MKKKIIISILLILVLIAAGISGWLWYDNNVDRSGFVEENGIRYYRDFHGDPVTGWQDINHARYFFDTNGAMSTGWQEIGSARYFFGTDGAMVTGWQDLQGSRHYFDETGALLYGWQEIGNTRYYFDSDGTMVTLWQDIGGNRYYFGSDGAMVTGQVSLDGQTYCFAENGAMITGWQETCYYLSDGTLALGWQEIDGQHYFFREDGTAYTGWLQEGEYRYYFQEDGSAAVGPAEIDGQIYYFSPGGIQIWLVNPWNYVPEDYEVDLVALDGGGRVDRSCCEALEQMLADCRAAGLSPYVCSSYRTYWDQLSLYEAQVAIHGVAYGKQIVAEPNTSEHQLGLAVDIVDSYYTKLNYAQENTATQQWIMEHCWEYGFILRYPNGTTDITGIIYEPWHYRYVGTEVSLELKELGITLEEYLGAVTTE